MVKYIGVPGVREVIQASSPAWNKPRDGPTEEWVLRGGLEG